MVELLGFDWSVAQVVAAGAVAALVLCLLIHLCAAACGWDDFFRCYGACGSALMSCCGLRTAKVAPEDSAGEARPRRPTRRGRRRRDEEGGGGGGELVGPLVTVNIKNGPDEGAVTRAGRRGKRAASSKAPQEPSDPSADDGAQDEQQAGKMPLLPFTLVWNARVY